MLNVEQARPAAAISEATDQSSRERAEVPAKSAAVQANARIGAALFQLRDAVAECLMRSVADWDKFRDQIAAVDDMKEHLRRDYHFMVDYLALRFTTGDVTYRSLYIGDKIRQAFFEPESAPEAQIERRRKILRSDAAGMMGVLKTRLDAADLEAFASELAEVERILTTRTPHALEVLFIGDCLYLDVTAFLAGASLADGITVNPTLMTTKNPAELRNVARNMSGRKFDLIFFSPFSYENSPGYDRLQWWHQGAMPTKKIESIADAAVETVTKTLELLGDLFECSVFVHNSANFRRHDGSLQQRVRNVASWRARRTGRIFVNKKLAEYVANPPAALAGRLFLFDEMELLREHGETALGRTFYNHDSRHPAGMGKWVAERYADIVAVQAHLLKKKLVVCDLDETLWKGIIGEGAVAHHRDRQEILKRLKAKGVVLAIASKNDPKNVKWDGGLLGADDFVSSQINWDSKVLNVQRIAQHLNLKAKDFVFVDDRADEREMVRSAVPGVYPMDALATRTWTLLELWSRLLDDEGADRTQLYREKNARDGFLQERLADEDTATMFVGLDLTVTCREVKKSDLKRVVELINRTNQFNTCGSRTSVKEASEWLLAGDRSIIAIDCSDKFGSMGTICICVMHTKADRIEIPVFVLSCRVFGYGIEHVAVNMAKRMARAAALPVAGLYQETSHNEPCRRVYPDNGFVWQDTAWIWSGDGEVVDPLWLKIRGE